MTRGKQPPYIYIACPWTPVGGGMYKVADYLIQAQSPEPGPGYARLRPLDTRGGGSAILSIGVLGAALLKLAGGRLSGRLAGVHVNMAERLSLFRKGVVILVASALGLPVVLHLHAAQLHHFYRSLPRPLQYLTRRVFSLPRVCIALGAAARQFMINELGVAPERVEVVINGVPEPTLARRRAASSEPSRILFLGNLSERKGVSDLLQALAHLSLAGLQYAATIAGGGDTEGYGRQAHELGIGQFVHFPGWMDQQQVARLMAEADLLVLPSYDEGLPLVILEAMANGVAVVCTPVGEIPSVLADGREAIFVQPGDVASIAAGLRRVLVDRPLREDLAANGRRKFHERFALDRFFANIAAIHRKHFAICGQPRETSTGTQGIQIDQ
jgi:glycosyltransferase involved in cell wall biosynthesis